MDALIYARVASDGSGTYDALARQLTECRRWAEANGHMVVGKFAEVRAGTGSGVAEAVAARAVAVGAELVAVMRADRLWRDLFGPHDVAVRFREAGVQVVTATGRVIVGSSEADDIFAGLSALLGEHESRARSERAEAAWRRRKAREGRGE